jgi:HSP20 family protein
MFALLNELLKSINKKKPFSGWIATRLLAKRRRFLPWTKQRQKCGRVPISEDDLTRNGKRRDHRPLHSDMNTITTWNPFRELDEVQNRLGTLFGGFPTRLFGNGKSLKLTDWSPQVDILEGENEYLVKADLPEMKKDEVKVTMENGVLCIAGDRKVEKEEKTKKYHRIERSFGSFERTFTLPEDAEANKIVAQFRDGVLTVHLPKKAVAKAKPIDIKVQ